jgi:hypothetical protein
MTDGRSIARWYMQRGLFPLALLSTLPWVLLFAVQLPWALKLGRAPLVLTIVLQVGWDCSHMCNQTVVISHRVLYNLQ